MGRFFVDDAAAAPSQASLAPMNEILPRVVDITKENNYVWHSIDGVTTTATGVVNYTRRLLPTPSELPVNWAGDTYVILAKVSSRGTSKYLIGTDYEPRHGVSMYACKWLEEGMKISDIDYKDTSTKYTIDSILARGPNFKFNPKPAAQGALSTKAPKQPIPQFGEDVIN